MRLDDSNDVRVEDQRGGGFSSAGLGGGGGGGAGLLLSFLPLVFNRFGCFGVAVVIGLFVLFSGGLGGIGNLVSPSSPATAPQVAAGGTAGSTGGAAGACDANSASRFSCNVLASVNTTWAQLLPNYAAPKLVFYDRNGQSGCGAAQAAMGPFYCPSDQGIYLDTSFYDDLRGRFGAPGDFAQAYVIAHEVGHHIQHVTGTIARVSRQQAQVGRTQGNALQVKVELQADCYAGVWAFHNRDRLEGGDVEEGLRAAAAIGDDTLQQQSQGRVVPESFTHGSAAQRQFWLRRGLDSGDPRQCDTFAA